MTAEPRHCSTCASSMPLTGPRRIRNGKLTCVACDPTWSPNTEPRRHLRRQRSLTVETRHLTRELLVSQAALLEPEDYAALADRPRTWGECAGDAGPCPWVSCRHHLYLDVSKIGSIKLNFPDLQPEDMENPCALRLAAAGPQHLEEVGVRLNLTRERVRQIEGIALRKLSRRAPKP